MGCAVRGEDQGCGLSKTAEGEAELLDPVAATGEAALEPELWPRALARIASHCGARGGHFCIVDPLQPERSRLWEHGLPGLDFTHGRIMDNPWAPTALQLPSGLVNRSEDFLPLDRLRRTPFYQEVLAPLDVEHVMGVQYHGPQLPANQRVLCVVVRAARQGPFEHVALERFRQIAPHLMQAAQVHLRLARAEAFQNAALELLDRLAPGIMMLDEQGEVCFANRNAEQLLAADDGLTSRNRRLAASHPDESRRLGELVVAAIRTGIGRGLHPGGAMLVSRADRRPLELLVAPLVARRLSLAVGRPVAVVLIHDPGQPVELAAQRLRELYQLTPAEARVARAVASGQGLEHAARELGLRVTTVRSHLQSCFEKTGTSRQAELVKLLLGISAALRQ
jgi:DNA-binding CsgD family transcriptional regulator/PAS domain-containing protein